jgi:hypothetical protein
MNTPKPKPKAKILSPKTKPAIKKAAATDKPNLFTGPKTTPKLPAKAKPNLFTKPKEKRKYTKSEQDFLDGQKLKKKILKKTGIYPNTAN